MTEITHPTVVVTADDGTSEVGSDEYNAPHVYDIDAADVDFTPTGTIAATNVQTAIAEVASESALAAAPAAAQAAAEATAAAALSGHAADGTAVHGITDTADLETSVGAQAKVDTHVNDATAAHAATAILVDSALLLGTSTNVQGSLLEIDTFATTTQDNLDDHGADPAAHTAENVSFAPVGTLAATDVQGAIEEMLTEGVVQVYQITFAKQGVVTVTTESDTPPPFHWTNDTGKTLTFFAARGRAEIGPSGSTMILDWNVGGTTIMTGTKVVLPDNAGAVSTVKQTTFSTTTVADGGVVSMNVDTNGGGAVQNLHSVLWAIG